ncbi:hypothetical protein B4107_3530 [Bacillus safensis]|nr:hypothetical protein B4107_3530 [Bacillus safensis]
MKVNLPKNESYVLGFNTYFSRAKKLDSFTESSFLLLI